MLDLFGEINDESVRLAVKFDRLLRSKISQRGSSITALVRIASRGGDTDAGLSVYALLRAMPCRVVTIGLGVVESAAIVIFCAGKERVCTPNTRFTLHASRTTIARSMSIKSLEETTAVAKSRFEAELRAVTSVSRSGIARVRRDFEDGRVLDAGEAKKYGLVSEIYTRLRYREPAWSRDA